MQPQVSASLSLDQRVYFYNLFRTARIAASRNAEDFESAIHAIEELGRLLKSKAKGMDDYRGPIAEALKFDGDPEFRALYNAVRLARNNAVHEGARARHLTDNAISLLILMGERMFPDDNDLTLSHFMVRDPVIVQPWMPIENARIAMLRHSFSSIPVSLDGIWHVIMDHELINFLSHPEQKQRKRMSVKDARGAGLKLPKCRLFDPSTKPRALLDAPVSDSEIQWPALVVQRFTGGDQHVIGIVSAFDLL